MGALPAAALNLLSRETCTACVKRRLWRRLVAFE
jgi:hypothetical protein